MATRENASTRGRLRDIENDRYSDYHGTTEVVRYTAAGVVVTTGDLEMVAGTLDVQDGGAATQASNKQTTVVISNNSGVITTHNESLAAGVETTFTVTNTKVLVTDVIVLNIASGGTSGEYHAFVTDVQAGSFDVTLANMSGSSASDVVVINFILLRGAVS